MPAVQIPEGARSAEGHGPGDEGAPARIGQVAARRTGDRPAPGGEVMEGMARCKRCGEVMEGTVRCEVCGRRADRVHFNEKLRAQFVEYLTEDWDGNPLMDEGDIADLTADDIEAIAREVGAAARAFLADTA